MNWKMVWQKFNGFFTENIWKILLFFTVFFIGIFIIKKILKIVQRIFNKTKIEKIAQNFFMVFFKIALYVVWLLILLSIIGIEISGIITAISALFIAVGLALQNIISNVANGIIIISTHIFKKEDFIEINNVSGNVSKINFLFTTIITADNKKITVPNSSIVNNEVINYGANKLRRVDFSFYINQENNIELVKQIVIKCMKTNKNVISNQETFCMLKSLSLNGLEFFAYCWCKNEKYWDVYFNVLEEVYIQFKINNISIPNNQYINLSKTNK